MRYQFPRTLKAAEASERSQWAIGDALIAETEDRQTGPRGLRAVEKELRDNGVELGLGYLSSLRHCAETFPPRRRHALPWKVHEAAGNPNTLDVIVKDAKKTGAKVTIWYVYDVLKAHAAEERAKRQEAEDAARKEMAKAEAEERKARERVRDAKSESERRRHAQEREAATHRHREASEKFRSVRLPPRRADRPAPAEDSTPMMVIASQLMALRGEAIMQLKRIEQLFDKYGSELTPAQLAATTEEALTLANGWREFALKVQKASPKQRGHLSVVNE